MRDIKSISEHNKLDDILDELDAAIPLAVKLQRENGNTNGALNALRDIVNKAIGINSPPASRASFSRAHIIEKAFDKARIVYQRANQPASAVASGVVSYFMAVKRLSASAELYAARADEQRSPKYQSYFHVDPQEAKQAAKMWEEDAKSELAKAHAALTDAAILAEATKLLKKMKMDVTLADKILAAVSQPPNNPWEMFNIVISALNY